ncbi:MAG TPA: ABC-F family ATP-binding cassette domain-containing protein [Streptosporangiaceae bacterium]|nr:ABC-F family ATP-binding cassette domain-containing protein [Streptosporangiaceae bacterium]
MNLVNLEAAVKAYGSRVLLDQVSLGVAAGDRVGVVGRNGSGKTTLLDVLAGATNLNGGRSTRARDLTIGYLPQSEQLSGSVRQIVFGDMAEHEWATDARVRGLIAALIADIALDAEAERLSGGERRRVALAALLRRDHDLLLLDEPTNHLDIEAIGWLAGYLTSASAGRGGRPPGTPASAGRGGRPPGTPAKAFVVITHDRWFLDAVCDRTWEVADGQVRSYDGGYSAYVLAKAERTRLAAAADQRRRNLLRKELAWLRRGPPARTSKPKFRIEAATALIADEPPPRDGVELSSIAAARLGKTVIDVTDVTLGFGDRTLLDGVTWQLGPGDRVGVVGVNGSGKTTLLRALAGDAGAEVPSGTVARGKTVRLGYLTQEPAPVEPGLRALEAAEQVRSSVKIGKGELSASQLLDRLGLRADRQWTLVSELSGGERRRLQLEMVLMAEPNVLLLDEPTNDLDIETLTELEDLLDGFPGSVVVVSHDRYFLERVTDHVIAIVDSKLAFLPGGVQEYLDRRAAATGALAGSPDQQPAKDAAGSGSARLREAKKELARLDRQLARLTGREAELHEALARAATDYARLVELGDELRGVESEKAAIEDRWLELAEEAAD